MPLILRLQKGSALTNEELDNNFIYLDDEVNLIRGGLNNVINVSIPQLREDLENSISLKQDAHPRLTSLSDVTSNGALFINENVITPRVFLAGSENIVITNADGIGGNPVIDIGASVLTNTNSQTISNKSISGFQNTITDVSLSAGVRDVLPIFNGGTGGFNAVQARSNLSALIAPNGTGLVVKNGNDSTLVRTLQVSGVGISVNNSDGVGGNPTVVSNATSNNTNSTIVSRDSNGNFSAGTITATLNGRAAIATEVDNGVYTTGSYNNPSWLTGLAGTKVTGIPNSSLNNNTVTINGVTVALGGSATVVNPITVPNTSTENVPNTLALRDGSGNFAAGRITSNLTGNVTGNLFGNAATVTNGVYTTGSYNNPSWITSLAGTKVTSIPNSSLQNSSITVNGTPISLGGSLVFDTGTSSNTVNTLVKRDSSGDFSAGRVTASFTGNLTGNVTGNVTGNLFGNAATVTNGVYTNGSYNNPSWITGLAGTKVTSIPNSSLQNSSITIDGTSVPLGGSVSGILRREAWVKFLDRNQSSPLILSSKNVSSVVRTATGRFRIVINNGVFTNSHFICSGMASDNDHVITYNSSTSTELNITVCDPGGGNQQYTASDVVMVMMVQ